eukprot:11395853-Alexandrium_andersonii.AAC.1
MTPSAAPNPQGSRRAEVAGGDVHVGAAGGGVVAGRVLFPEVALAVAASGTPCPRRRSPESAPAPRRGKR